MRNYDRTSSRHNRCTTIVLYEMVQDRAIRVAKLSADADIKTKMAADADIESKIVSLYQPTYVEM